MLKFAIFLLLAIVIISLMIKISQNTKCKSEDKFTPYQIDIQSDGVKRSV
jgi:hypothetical protein